MERTLGTCADCEEIVVVALVDGEVVPVGQTECANCGGTEFRVTDDPGDSRFEDDD